MLPRNNITRNQVYNIDSLLNDNKYRIANFSVFSDLARYYASNNMYFDALRVCNQAIECGYLDDGTKKGMLGRKVKLEKAVEKENRKGMKNNS